MNGPRPICAGCEKPTTWHKPICDDCLIAAGETPRPYCALCDAVGLKVDCPRGHSYAEHGVRHGKDKWRRCRICILGRGRVANGWPEDLAYSLPKVSHGTAIFRGLEKLPLKGTKGKRTHCRRGHALEGDNIYKKPGGGRQCKMCHHAAVAAWLKRGKVAIMNKATPHNG